jgi:hypothetical protein
MQAGATQGQVGRTEGRPDRSPLPACEESPHGRAEPASKYAFDLPEHRQDIRFILNDVPIARNTQRNAAEPSIIAMRDRVTHHKNNVTR